MILFKQRAARYRFINGFLGLLGLMLLVACQSSDENAGGKAQGGPSGGGNPSAQQQPANVGFIDLQPTAAELTENLPGRVVSYQVAEIRPQVSGIIESRLFEEGTQVEEGQQLYQIDPDTFEADVEMAKANVERAEALSTSAKRQVSRYSQLMNTNSISQQDFDNSRDALAQAQASVSVAKAELRAAQVQLEYTKVFAPISGYISTSSVTKGALVTALQETPLATIRALDPVYIDISQAVSNSRNLQQRLMQSRLSGEQTQYQVTVMLGDGSQPYPEKGRLTATDLSVDRQTGAIKLRAEVPNPNNALLPGMFVRAVIENAGQSKVLVVPQKSVSINPDGSKHVWVANDQNKAEKRSVQTGSSYKNQWVILQGLQAGDRVIVEGTMMLRDGTPLKLERLDAANQQKAVSGNGADEESKAKPAGGPAS